MQVAAGKGNQITVQSWSGADFAADKGDWKLVTDHRDYTGWRCRAVDLQEADRCIALH